MSPKHIGSSFTENFKSVPLHFEEGIQVDVFASKNNKSVEETLAHSRYAKLLKPAVANYGESLDQPLGEFPQFRLIGNGCEVVRKKSG